jgi:hypothetical protein
MCDIRGLTISFLERLKAIDVFGYKVTLLVDKQNSTHRTYCGAVASVIYIVLCVFIFFFLTEHAVLDLTSPLYDANANHLAARRRLLEDNTKAVTILTN